MAARSSDGNDLSLKPRFKQRTTPLPQPVAEMAQKTQMHLGGPHHIPHPGSQEKTYSDYLRAARETEKEEMMEPSQNQMADKPSKPKATSFFHL